MLNKRGQLAVFVIIALVIVGGILVYVAVREGLFALSISPELDKVYTYYGQCIEQEARAAIDLAGSRGGRIYTGEYIPGSEYAPFSSQFNFLGEPSPYWFYVAGNGIVKENVPTKAEISAEISKYIEENLNANCNFDQFYQDGYDITIGTPKATTAILDNSVQVAVNSNLGVSKGENSALKTSYSATITSKLGKFYNIATKIYQKEKIDAFIENYSIDVLRLYAPVDGVEISCSGRIWKTREVIDELKSGLEANINAIKMKGNYYTLSKKENSYFVVDLPSDEAVNMIYSKAWPTKVEIDGADNELMIAKPVGTAPGMGAMGFCYAPYHFVYDLSFPVMIQVYDEKELFQFPVTAIISKNSPREPVFSELAVEEESPDVCAYKTNDIEVSVYNTNLNPIDANISYICFDQSCTLGETKNGVFSGKAPACGNGFITANAEGYAEKRQLLSTNAENSAEIILDKEYDTEIELEVGGKPLNGMAIVSFSGERAASTVLPDEKKVKLTEGMYNVSVFVYENSSITIPAAKKTQCQEVTRSGLAGFFGATEEKCFDINLPETKIEFALAGGGNSEIYLLPSDLEKGRIKLKVGSLPRPTSIDALAQNYELFDDMGVNLDLT